MFARLASFTERRAPWVVAGWFLAVVVVTATAPSLQDVGTQDNSDFLPADAPSQQADRVLRELFPDDPTRDSALLVFERPGGLTPADHAYVDALGASLAIGGPSAEVISVQSVATTPDLAPILRSRDGAAELLIMSFRAPPFTHATNEAVAQIRDHLAATAPDGLSHHLTGIAGLAKDQGDALLESFDRTAIVTVVLVLLILIAVYRSAVAPLLPLITIGAAFAVAQGVVAHLAQAGFKVSSMAGTFMVVMIFGAGTDYCLFVVSRHREELAHGNPVPVTVRRTMTVMGSVIAASAATVIVGFLSQLSADFGVYRTMGPAMGVAIFITLVAGLTLTPALLRLVGTRAFWPQRLSRSASDGHVGSARWERLAAIIRARPAEMLLAGVIALLIPAAGLGWFRQSFDLVKDLPGSADARQGFEALSRHYPGGMLSPVNVVVSTDGPILDDAKLAAIDRLTDTLRRQPGVAEVRSITQPAGAPLTVETLQAFSGNSDSAALGLDPNQVDLTPLLEAVAAPGGLRFNATLLAAYPELAAKLGVFQGADGNSTRLIVALAGNPYEQDALDAFRQIDDTAATALAGSPLSGARLVVGGPTSFYSDMQAIGNSDFRVIAAILLASIFVVLVLLLRSLVAPLFLLGTVVLSYGATMGITAVFFQGIVGDPGISFWLPAFLFIILVALGADYNIFIMSRIREEADAGHEIHEAATRGLVLTGRVITSAGLILAGTFAALIVAPLPNLRHIGFGVTVGVLLDTFLVRSVLVPSVTVLLGRWTFWPSAPGSAATRPRATRVQIVAATVALAAFAAGLALVAVSGGTERPVTTIAGPTLDAPARPAALTGPEDDTAIAPGGSAPTSTVPPGTATSSAPSNDLATAGTAAPPATFPPGDAAFAGLAVPATGGWRFRVEGTRRVGAAGSTQPFAEEVTTEVTRVGGTDTVAEIRLRTESDSGTEEYTRRHQPQLIELLATRLSAGLTSFGGTLDPPQLLIRWPLEIGDRWASDWSSGSTTGHSSSEVIGARDVTAAGRSWRCYDIRTDTTFTGDAQGEQHQTACWVPDLGMSIDDDQDYRGTYNGVSFEISSHTSLLATP